MSKLFDYGKEPYAHVFAAHSSPGYAQIGAVIHNVLVKDEWARIKPVIRIHAQIGGDHGESYAWSWGVDSSSGTKNLMDAETLTACAKAMRKIEAALVKYEDELGSAKTYGEYMQRILAASGVPVVFVNEDAMRGLPYGFGVADLARYHPKRNATMLRDEISKLEHQCLMSLDSKYRNRNLKVA